jgi:hypothetical protein
LKVRQISSIDFSKSGGQKRNNFQAKTFGFKDISFPFLSLNTKIFSYARISQLSTMNRSFALLALPAQ